MSPAILFSSVSPAILFAFFFWLGLPVAQAEEVSSFGFVTFVQGEASARQPGRERLLGLDSRVEVGDELVTGKDARLRVRFDDGSVVVLGGNTSLTVARYVRRGEDAGAAFNLLKGAFRAVTGLLTKVAQPRFVVSTPSATIGVRGTDFWGGYLTPDAVDVLVLGGKGVYVENSAGRVELAPGFGTTVAAADRPPLPAKRWPQEKVRRALNTVNLPMEAE